LRPGTAQTEARNYNARPSLLALTYELLVRVFVKVASHNINHILGRDCRLCVHCQRREWGHNDAGQMDRMLDKDAIAEFVDRWALSQSRTK
jgi:hypothetical protein